MKTDLPARSLVILFVVLAVLYLGAFYGWEHWQRRLGPWQLTFISDGEGRPSVAINQPRLQIQGVRLVFEGETIATNNLSRVVLFAQLQQRQPFGRVIYEDLRSMPGVVTFDFFGHEIELRPRVLVINRKQIPWTSHQVTKLSLKDKPAEPPKPPKSQRRSATERRYRAGAIAQESGFNPRSVIAHGATSAWGLSADDGTRTPDIPC